MRLSPTAFNRHLAHIGQQVKWAQSFACPCIKRESGQPDPRCPHCLGKGHLWSASVPCVSGVANQKTQQQWMGSGMWMDGDIVVTVPGDSPMWAVGPFDRVTMVNGAERFSTSLTRAAPTERLLFQASAVDRVFWIDPVSKAIVEGGIPALSSDGRPTWTAGEPPAGVGYSITGQRLPEYYCLVEMPSSRNEHSGAPLPRRVVLRRFDLLGRRSAT